MADKGFNHNEFYPSAGVSGAIKKQIEELIKKAVNADWNQTDSTAPDYINNKPFGVEYTVKGKIIEETTSDFDGIITETTDTPFVDGEVYLVEWDGETYEVTAHETENGDVILGNGTLHGYDNVDPKDNDLPFLFVTTPNGDDSYTLSKIPEINGEHTYSVEAVEKTVTPLPDEYLPDDAATKEYVDSLLGNANALTIKGGIDGGTGDIGTYTPEADAGDIYIATTNGKINGVDVKAGDILICTEDNTSKADSGNYSEIMQKWLIVNSSTNLGEADWQAAEGENGYIKNRTHYVNRALYQQDTATSKSESGAPVFVQGENNISPYVFTSLMRGETITVKLDGQIKEGTWTADSATAANMYTFISDDGMITAAVTSGDKVSYRFVLDGEHSIDYYTESVVKIDKKYLPDGLGDDGIPLIYKFTIKANSWSDNKVSIGNDIFEENDYLYTPYGGNFEGKNISMTVEDGAAVFTAEDTISEDIVVYIKKEKIIYKGEIENDGFGLTDRDGTQFTDRNGNDLYGRG